MYDSYEEEIKQAIKAHHDEIKAHIEKFGIDVKDKVKERKPTILDLAVDAVYFILEWIETKSTNALEWLDEWIDEREKYS